MLGRVGFLFLILLVFFGFFLHAEESIVGEHFRNTVWYSEKFDVYPVGLAQGNAVAHYSFHKYLVIGHDLKWNLVTYTISYSGSFVSVEKGDYLTLGDKLYLYECKNENVRLKAEDASYSLGLTNRINSVEPRLFGIRLVLDQEPQSVFRNITGQFMENISGTLSGTNDDTSSFIGVNLSWDWNVYPMNIRIREKKYTSAQWKITFPSSSDKSNSFIFLVESNEVTAKVRPVSAENNGFEVLNKDECQKKIIDAFVK